ncbi:hypothetical protein SY88_19270 [Clostridiales bacterium PH28_bin88]|nr:hypothetical protein SY88_19270 [Clostridiales bacterium PH28_bin88]
MKVDAIILAGSSNDGKLRECSDAANEALITIGERIMVDFVVTALRESRYVERIAIVGPVEELARYFSHIPDLVLAQPGRTAMQSVENGITVLALRRRVLVVTSDIPLISPDAIDDFISRCGDQQADLYYPIVPKEVNEAKYPGVKRTYVKLREGTFTGGNLFLVNPGIVHQVMQKAEELVRLRKSPVALARAVGFSVILKYLLKLLSVPEAERKVSRMLGIRGVVVVSHYPEVGIDVDKPSDLELVRDVLVS